MTGEYYDNIGKSFGLLQQKVNELSAEVEAAKRSRGFTMSDVAEMASHLARAYVPAREVPPVRVAGHPFPATSPSDGGVSLPPPVPADEPGPGWTGHMVLDETRLDPLARAMLKHLGRE